MGSIGPGDLDMSKLSERDKQELQVFAMNESQKSSVQQRIHGLADMCFRKCVTKVNSSTLDRYEEPCMQNCVDRFLDTNGIILRKLETMRGS